MMEGTTSTRNYGSWLDMSNDDGLSRFLKEDSMLRNTQSVQQELSSTVTFRTSSNSTFNRAFNFGHSKSESGSLEIDEEVSQVETIEQIMKKICINDSTTRSKTTTLHHCDSCTCKPQSETQVQLESTAKPLPHKLLSSIRVFRKECNHLTNKELESEEEKIEDFEPSYFSTPLTEEIGEGEFDTTFIAEISSRSDVAKKCLNSEFATCLTDNVETPSLMFQSCRSLVSAESFLEGLYSPVRRVTTNQKNEEEEEKDDVIQKQICTMLTPKGRKNISNRPGLRIGVSVPRSSCHALSQTPNSHSKSVQHPSSSNDDDTPIIARSSTGPQIQFEIKGSVRWS